MNWLESRVLGAIRVARSGVHGRQIAQSLGANKRAVGRAIVRLRELRYIRDSGARFIPHGRRRGLVVWVVAPTRRAMPPPKRASCPETDRRGNLVLFADATELAPSKDPH